MTTASARVVLLATLTLLGSPMLGLAISVGGAAVGMTERDSGFAGSAVAIVAAWCGLARALQLHWPHRSSMGWSGRFIATAITAIVLLPLTLVLVALGWLRSA